MSLAERFASALREQRILRHCRAAIAAQRSGDGTAARVAWQQMSQEIEARTPEQVACCRLALRASKSTRWPRSTERRRATAAPAPRAPA
jgi:hypothetical protein